jgi:hypothetical protein
MFTQIFWLESFTTNTLNINVHKMYECDENPSALLQCKKFQKMKFQKKMGH